MTTRVTYTITDHGNGNVALEVIYLETEAGKHGNTYWTGKTVWQQTYASVASAAKAAADIDAAHASRYILRFTQDLRVIATGATPDALKRLSDYKIHIWDMLAGKVVWQNAESVRYGDVGVE